MSFRIDPATAADVPLILDLIRELAEYEQLAHEVVATEADIHAALFAERPAAETVIGRLDGEAVGFALFFRNFSTFLGRPGLYLEDLYVRPAFRGRGFGRRLLAHLARRPRLRTRGVVGAGLERAGHRGLPPRRCRAAGRVDHVSPERGGARPARG